MDNNMILPAIKAILAMKYFKNIPVNACGVGGFPTHEMAIASTLTEHGFGKWSDWDRIRDKTLFRYQTNMRFWVENPELSGMMPVGTFIEHPFGTNDAPDFFIKISDTFVMAMEAKSSQGYTPVWNSCLPKPDTVYVFCSEKANQTTVFRGGSIMTNAQRNLITEYIESRREEDEELNNKLFDMDATHRGITYYTRPMIHQHGTSDYTNYFKHRNRKKDEQDVFDWIKEKLLITNFKIK